MLLVVKLFVIVLYTICIVFFLELPTLFLRPVAPKAIQFLGLDYWML